MLDFERMVLDHQDRLFAFGLGLSGSRADAEEIAQEAFLRAYRALLSYPEQRLRELKVRPWLYQIALNVFRNRVRGGRPPLGSLNGSEPSRERGPEETVVGTQEVVRRLAALPARYREPLVLRYVQDLPLAEVAAVLGQPVGTVKSNVHRGLQQLRGGLSDEG
ncbi:MAG TPA: sigma-70 family RNA polymerase sigma factor [Candidatus Acidoferrales bacterium]|nr:sigma-70 family RNA polymerase sigma factor [Candidatus Acidoferrales bacterium]